MDGLNITFFWAARGLMTHSSITFQHIWCMGPCLRTLKINCAFFRTCTTVCLAGTCGPCAEACGLYFAKIKVRYQRLPDGEEEKDIMVV